MNDLKRKRGRPKLTDSGRQPKDNRKVLDSEPLVFEESLVGTFDGKLNPTTNTLKVYKYHGDITKFEEAIGEYAILNKIDVVIVKFIIY